MAETDPPFTRESIQRMLSFLPAFERGEYAGADAAYMQTGRDLPSVGALRSEVYQSGFAFPFDWSGWKEGRAMRLTDVATADLLTLRKLLTAFVRNDRFCGGALSAKCSDGWVEQILRRLRVLADGGR